VAQNEVQQQTYEHGKEPAGSMKIGEFHDQLSDYELLKTDLTSYSFWFPFVPEMYVNDMTYLLIFIFLFIVYT
jgi:hypothetical protein